DFAGGFDDRHRTGRHLAERSDRFRMPAVADEHDVAAGLDLAFGLAVDLADQRARGIEIDHLPPVRFCRNRLGHAMGAEHHRPIFGYFVELFDKHRAFGSQAIDYEAIMDDLVPHVDRGAKASERTLHDLDRAVDTGTESARRG